MSFVLTETSRGWIRCNLADLTPPSPQFPVLDEKVTKIEFFSRDRKFLKLMFERMLRRSLDAYQVFVDRDRFQFVAKIVSVSADGAVVQVSGQVEVS